MSHTCHALYCNEPCRPTLLMCPRHWAMVSRATQGAVYSHYRRGQCDDMRPSPAWFSAAKTAQREVAEREGKKMPPGIANAHLQMHEDQP